MRDLVLGVMVLVMVGCSNPDTKTAEVEDIPEVKVVRQLFHDTCETQDEVYYATQVEATEYFRDTRNMTNFWDTRYGDISINGCDVTIAVDDTTPSIEFGGPQATLIYRIPRVYPWASGNSLMLQTNFSKATVEGSVHGGISFNFFIINRYTSEQLNYVISIHSYGRARVNEVQEVLYDPTTDTQFVSTTVDVGNTYVTVYPTSATLNEEGFFRAIITADNLPIVNPSDWYILFVGLQYEVEEEGSIGSVQAEFSDFSAHIIQ